MLKPSEAFFFVVLSILISLSSFSEAYTFNPKGKVDVGPAYIHVDILESNKTIKRMDLIGVKADATVILLEEMGWCVKPGLLYGKGGSGHGEIFSGGIAFGHCFPLKSWGSLTPNVGIIYSYVKTRISIPFFAAMGIEHFTEKFRSVSPYVGIDATYTFCKGFRICGMYQYAWSRTHTTIEGLLKSNSHAQGPNYALQLEYDITDQWSVQLGGAYNISLSKEKHGIRGAGAKLGLAYWF